MSGSKGGGEWKMKGEKGPGLWNLLEVISARRKGDRSRLGGGGTVAALLCGQSSY